MRMREKKEMGSSSRTSMGWRLMGLAREQEVTGKVVGMGEGQQAGLVGMG